MSQDGGPAFRHGARNVTGAGGAAGLAPSGAAARLRRLGAAAVRLAAALAVLAGGLAWAQGPEAPRWELVPLDNGVEALALFGPEEGTALMLADAGLLSLAFPEERDAVDDFMTRIASGRPLYFVVTASAPATWEPALVFVQEGRSFEARYPDALSVLTGRPGSAAPGEPAAGVILLPQWFNLRAPLQVTWEGAHATFRFRR